MKKIGRNDPCHCGSGKKYKKCCFNKDKNEGKLKKIELEKEKEIKNLERGDKMLEELRKFFPALGNDEDYNYFDFENSDNPKISEEEQQKVIEWWEKYKNLEDIDELKQHFDDFLNNNSADVIANLGIHNKIFFELLDKFIEKGRVDEIITYLIDFRKNYPEIYEKSAEFYDFEVITWHVSKDRKDEVKNYFNYFEQNPIKNEEKLFETINFLYATNNAELIIPLIKKIYKEVNNSNDLFNGHQIVDGLNVEIYSKYLDKEINTENIEKLTDELKELEIDFDDHFYDIIFWENRLKYIIKKYDKWNNSSKNEELFNYFLFEISSNFMRFLHEEKNITYISAQYYGQLIYKYYLKSFENEEVFENIFSFEEDEIDQIIGSLSKYYLSISITKSLSLLNTLYYFAEYLFVCGNFDNTEKKHLQKITTKFHNLVYKKTMKTQIKTALFSKFPIFG